MDENKSDQSLEGKSERELRALKLWLFSENVRIENEKKKLQELQNRFIWERSQFQEEMKALNRATLQARAQLKQEEQFFQKKMQILENGFMELDLDRKQLAHEKEAFKALQLQAELREAERSADPELLFAGVKSAMALKKRYRDLLKIYHPDNVAGDSSVVLLINREYERLSRKM